MAIRVTGVSKRFGVVRAVDRLDLSVDRGCVMALLGPNGAGKTTAISMMLGLAPPDTGTVLLYEGSPVDAVRAGRVGAMLQDGAFVPGATVRDVVELARALYPRPLDTDRVLSVAGLTGLAGRRLDKLSGGEAQRARFAFALAGGPELLVLDEPSAAMDVAARQAFWTAVRSYAADGNTVLFSTHQLHEADEHADRIVVLAAGRVVADGTPAQVRVKAGVREGISLDQAFLALTDPSTPTGTEQ
ncbi:ABC transporter ATP-binding protein [Actinoplanes sp. LDG1-06]|uniref:ABC transporter ATP-binding protein n=2 Tax=Paractinoplanes ovalisporus TaxID=2810368 RepID=A0ABS2AFJ2_9ACTN|nr:ABC transporter ATP-binding protein [Actinoplanes ovalisporus]